MPPWINLSDGGYVIGEYDLPDTVTGEAGFTFRLTYAVRAGGNGVVFCGQALNHRHQIPELCAVKFLRQRDSKRMDRFNNEIRIMSQLRHERIASYFDRGTVEVAPDLSVPWVAMELGGPNLQDHVRKQGVLTLGQLVWIGSEICQAINQLHTMSLIHRDIKPANFVWAGETTRHIKMIDFGIAKYVGEDVSARALDDFTQDNEFVGPAFYSSPELIAYKTNKQHPVTSKSDMFQLGKVLWFLGTGIISAGVPTKTKCPAEGKLWEVVMSLIDDDPQSRVASAMDIARSLEAL